MPSFTVITLPSLVNDTDLIALFDGVAQSMLNTGGSRVQLTIVVFMPDAKNALATVDETDQTLDKIIDGTFLVSGSRARRGYL